VSHIMMEWKEGNTDPFVEDLRPQVSCILIVSGRQTAGCLMR